MLKIALTGGIGSGKSEVANIFSSLGVPVIDTDVISRELVYPQSVALQKIADKFGDEFLLDDGNLDRAKMRRHVFKDKTARKALEDILHPLIRQEVQHRLATLTARYAIIVIPLLVETGQQADMDRVLLVDASEAVQRKRVMLRDRIDSTLFEKIMSSQADRKERQLAADDIILNDSDELAPLKQKVIELHEKYLQLTGKPDGS